MSIERLEPTTIKRELMNAEKMYQVIRKINEIIEAVNARGLNAKPKTDASNQGQSKTGRGVGSPTKK